MTLDASFKVPETSYPLPAVLTTNLCVVPAGYKPSSQAASLLAVQKTLTAGSGHTYAEDEETEAQRGRVTHCITAKLATGEAAQSQRFQLLSLSHAPQGPAGWRAGCREGGRRRLDGAASHMVTVYSRALSSRSAEAGMPFHLLAMCNPADLRLFRHCLRGVRRPIYGDLAR